MATLSTSISNPVAPPQANIKQIFYWLIAAIALITLADPFPQLAILLAWILVVGILLMNWKDYSSLLNPPK